MSDRIIDGGGDAVGSNRRRRLELAIGCAASLMLSVAGCADAELPRLADYLDELEFDVPLESADYVSLGKFDIAVAADALESDAAQKGGKVELRLKFDLQAETAPEYKPAVESAIEEHQGAISDMVLTIVRTSAVEELTDPRLAAIKSRLTEAVRPIFGKKVRQLVFNKALTDSNSSTQSHAPPKADAHGSHH